MTSRSHHSQPSNRLHHGGHKSSRHRPSRFTGLWMLAAVAVFYGLVFMAWTEYRKWISAVRLDTLKSSYLHYEFVELRLRARDPELLKRWRSVPPRVRVRRDGKAVTTIANLTEVELPWNEALGAFVGRWPCPWNAPAGEYVPELAGELGSAYPMGLRLGADGAYVLQGTRATEQQDHRMAASGISPERLQTQPFRIEYLRPKPLPHRFVALTMESVMPLSTMKVKTPDGEVKGWRGLLDWAKYMEADAFWILAGQTPGDKPGQTWISYNLPVLPLLAQEAHRRGLKFGVWTMCYLTMSKTRLPRYRYAMEVENGTPVYTRAISLGDPQRPRDIAEFLKSFRDVPEVDFVGLDYIRNALGGYELVDDFAAEMPGIRLPPEWGRFNRDERMVWFARKKILRKDIAFIDAWQWWRARRVALIVKGIKEDLGDSKSLWAFTLTWQRGWHHGQDPVMMSDAGVDVDSLMLYEATAPQFEWMIQDWHSYAHRRDVQLMVGDVVDWPLHQHSPRGPGEFHRRTMRAAQDIYQDGPAAGLFVHDLARALWGRLGPYSTMDWMQEARSAARRFRALEDVPPHESERSGKNASVGRASASALPVKEIR